MTPTAGRKRAWTPAASLFPDAGDGREPGPVESALRDELGDPLPSDAALLVQARAVDIAAGWADADAMTRAVKVYWAMRQASRLRASTPEQEGSGNDSVDPLAAWLADDDAAGGDPARPD